MGKASSAKKVARAARAGGVRPGSRRSFAWPAVIVGMVVIGIVLIVVSRNERDTTASPALGDHWHAAFGIDNCGTFLPVLVDQDRDVLGLHTHVDGLMHIHPFSSAVTGKKANIENWGDLVGLELNAEQIKVAGGPTLNDGDDCNGKPGHVVLKVWSGLEDETGHIVEGDPGKYAPQDGELITLAFVADDATIERPPSGVNLEDPLAAEEGRTPVSVPTEESTTTPPPADTGSTTTETTASQ